MTVEEGWRKNVDDRAVESGVAMPARACEDSCGGRTLQSGARKQKVGDEARPGRCDRKGVGVRTPGARPGDGLYRSTALR
jgi:hypothetical protein